MVTLFRAGALCAALLTAAGAQEIPVNYDESKVGTYTLPDPLVFQDGTRVRNARAWSTRRRPEILRLFEANVYGRSPGRPEGMSFEVIDTDDHALNGRAVRKQITVHFTRNQDGPKMRILIYLPAAARRPVPLFLCLSLHALQTVNSDPGILLGEEWDRAKKVRLTDTEHLRGASKEWFVEKMLARGYGLAVVYYCDLEPDFQGGIAYGVRPLFFRAGQTAPAPTDWGAIGAWAWGLSRAMDYLETDKAVDAKRVAIMGQSRLGKTVLWAGAQDTRFAMVIANNSGEGGAALSRRWYGETVKHLNVNFPWQFCENYQKYGDHVDQLPVDQHMLLALIAPRPVYLGCAQDDQWADPKGEFLAAVAATPVYRLLGKPGLGTDRMPAPHHPIHGTIGYHLRAGQHEVTAYDWEQFLAFANWHLRP